MAAGGVKPVSNLEETKYLTRECGATPGAYQTHVGGTGDGFGAGGGIEPDLQLGDMHVNRTRLNAQAGGDFLGGEAFHQAV